MTTHKILTDTSMKWVINASNDAWILGKHATLSVINDYAVYIAAQYENNKIFVLGDIFNTGSQSYGVRIEGDHNKVTIGVDSQIYALAGVLSDGADTTVINRGDIDGVFYGVGLNDDSMLINSGKMDGYIGAELGTNTVVTNLAGGQILGGWAGVSFVAGVNSLTNHGIISGANCAIEDGAGGSRIINRGRIDGYVLLQGGDDIFDTRNGTLNGFVSAGAGNDVIDTRNGTLNGRVYGDDGNDTFYISESVEILEFIAQGFDNVFSTISLDLADHVERLILHGRGDITFAKQREVGALAYL